MKKNKIEIAKILKLILVILIVVLLSLISFVGIFDKVNNISVKNMIKEYNLGKDLDGSRIIKLQAKNSDDSEVSAEDINSIKSVIEKRLNGLGVEDYTVSPNYNNAEFVIELTEDNQTDYVLSNLTGTGKFEVSDAETKEVLLDNSNLDNTSVKYYNGQTGTVIYLAIKLNNEGKDKLKGISNTYVKSEKDESNTDENNDNKTQEKKVTLKIDEQEVLSTSFDEEISNGEWDLTMGSATKDENEIQANLKSGSAVATLLNSGAVNQTLTVTGNSYVESMINKTVFKVVIGLIFASLIVSLIYMIVKYGKLGLIMGLTYIFETALFMILIRYTNTVITVSSLVSAILLVTLNHVLTNRILKNYKETKKIGKSIGKAYLQCADMIVVLTIVAVVCVLVKWVPLNGIGLPLFWGLISIAISNIITAITID